MFNPIKRAGQLKNLRDQAKAVQRGLAQIEAYAEKGGVAAVVSGDQKVKSLTIHGEDQKLVMEVINQALSKAQKKASQRMQGMMGDLTNLFGG